MTEERNPPFYITPEEEIQLRIAANRLEPAVVVAPATSFDDYVRQLMIPSVVMDLVQKAALIRFSAWEVEAIRASLNNGMLRQILDWKWDADKSHPPYIRVACTGIGKYDKQVLESAPQLYASFPEDQTFGSPAVLEIWPGQHYSPIHSHGETTGIIYALTGQIDAMLYEELKWPAKNVGLVTLTPGQAAWLTDDRFAVHKVFCPMPKGQFGATFHVYLNRDELHRGMFELVPQPGTRDIFRYIDEETHEIKEFETDSDVSWRVLRQELARIASSLRM